MIITNQQVNKLNAPVQAARAEHGAAQAATAAIPGRIRLGELAPDMVRLDAETKQITHAIRMAAYNAETTLARALAGRYARAEDEACALIREALTVSGDIHPGHGELLIRLDQLTAPRRTQAPAALCQQLNATKTRYPGQASSSATRSNPTSALHKRSLYVSSSGPTAPPRSAPRAAGTSPAARPPPGSTASRPGPGHATAAAPRQRRRTGTGGRTPGRAAGARNRAAAGPPRHRYRPAPAQHRCPRARHARPPAASSITWTSGRRPR
jgi:hypothetical protein